MEYNTQRSKLQISEYGRNVQKLIENAIAIENREERTNYAKAIINVMAQVNPQAKDTLDYKHKLWDHLYIMSDFRLDVDAPYNLIQKDEISEKPEPLKYKNNKIKYRHYGKNMEEIIEKVINMEDGEEKSVLITMIANHLKKSYLNWNRNSVNDDLIYEQFAEMTHGKLQLSENFQLRDTRDILKVHSNNNANKKNTTNNPTNSNGNNGKPKNNNNTSRQNQNQNQGQNQNQRRTR